MKVNKTDIEGAYLIDLNVHGDQRGFFLESYEKRRYAEHGIDVEFVQDNRSYSRRGVIRGLHYQVKNPIGQLIYVTHGVVFDVGVDLRPASPSFGKYVAFTLSAENNQQLFLPAGVAHGFCTLADDNEILYKCSEFYYPNDEAGVLWNDPDIGIPWPIEPEVLSERDAAYPRLKDVPSGRLPSLA